MEQKLTIHKNRSHSQTPPSLWGSSSEFPAFLNPSLAAPSFWSPANFNPLWWENGLFDDTRRNMTQIFDGFFDNWSARGIQPHADITEDKKSLRIKMDVPGLEADDIDISTDDGVLTISADKQEKQNGTESSYSFSYSTTLPEGANVDQADVNFSNHKLSIEIPKGNGAAPKPVIGKAIGNGHIY